MEKVNNFESQNYEANLKGIKLNPTGLMTSKSMTTKIMVTEMKLKVINCIVTEGLFLHYSQLE